MNNTQVRLQYDSWHEQMASQEQYDIFSLPWYKTVIKLLPVLNGKNVIEVGCGRGVFANFLATKYPEAKITAVDFSESAIALANNRYGGVPNLNFEVGNAESLHLKQVGLIFIFHARPLSTDFDSRIWKNLFKPFGRHFTYMGGNK